MAIKVKVREDMKFVSRIKPRRITVDLNFFFVFSDLLILYMMPVYAIIMHKYIERFMIMCKTEMLIEIELPTNMHIVFFILLLEYSPVNIDGTREHR